MSEKNRDRPREASFRMAILLSREEVCNRADGAGLLTRDIRPASFPCDSHSGVAAECLGFPSRLQLRGSAGLSPASRTRHPFTLSFQPMEQALVLSNSRAG